MAEPVGSLAVTMRTRLGAVWLATVVGAAIAASLLCSCTPAPPVAHVSSAFTDEDAKLFDDGIDFVADPGGLEGSWLEDWQKDLERRVGSADVVATVTVSTIRTDVDPSQRQTIHLVADVDKNIVGKAPGSELELTVEEGQPGFATVQGNDQRILNQPFVAYVKWYRTQDGDVKPHWHLAPATPTVVEQTQSLADRRAAAGGQGPRTTVVVHPN